MTQPPQAILDLVELFARNVHLYRSPSYNETQARHEFIDPFFAALQRQLADAKTLRLRMPAATDAGGYGCRRLRTPTVKELLQRQTSS